MKIIFISSFVFTLLFAGGVLNAAWSQPSGAPSDITNTQPPITEGPEDQVKAGALSVGSVLIDTNVYIQGNNAGTSSENTSLEVDGKFGADEFCSEMGGACFTAGDMVDFITKTNP